MRRKRKAEHEREHDCHCSDDNFRRLDRAEELARENAAASGLELTGAEVAWLNFETDAR